MFELPSTVEKPKIVPPEFRGGDSLPIPVPLLVEIHNGAPEGSAIRTRIQAYIRAYGEANPKAHWTRSIVISANGDLAFDDLLFDIAIYRGKQDTYSAAAREKFEALKRDMELASKFQESEALASHAFGTTPRAGTPLLPLRDLSADAQAIRSRAVDLNYAADLLNSPAGEPSPECLDVDAPSLPDNSQ